MLMRGKVTESRAQNKEFHFFFLPRQSNFANFLAKLQKNGRTTKEKCIFFLSVCNICVENPMRYPFCQAAIRRSASSVRS